MPFDEDLKSSPPEEPPRTFLSSLFSRLTAKIQAAPWFSLLLIGLVIYILLRQLAVVADLPARLSALIALTLTLGLLAWKSLSAGTEATRQTISESWRKLSDWLAVTSWKRLLAVGLCALISTAIISDGFDDGEDLASLMFGVLFALFAIKLALPHSPHTPLQGEDQALSSSAQSAQKAEATNGNWLQRLSWPRLILVGLLLLLAAAIAGEVFDSNGQPGVKITRVHKPDAAPSASASGISAGSADGDEDADSEDYVASSPSSDKKADVKLGPSGISIVKRGADGKITDHVQIGQGGITISKDKEDGSVEVQAPGLAKLPGMSPEKAQKLEEKIREKIEESADEDSDVEGAKSARLSFSLGSLAFLAIVSLAIMKLLAGEKHRAEQDAGTARIAADLARLEREAADAKLHAMQAQIEPHFLFNTLASVDQLIRTDPLRASQVQKTLIQYLRAAIPQMRDDAQRSTLGRQISMSRAYLEIMQVRMEERLEFAIEVPEGILCAEFPSMMLQTLIENSIKHGLEPKSEGGRIDVVAEIARGKLRVSVADTGVGFTADAKDGVGLPNIRERLRLLYGDSATLILSPNEGGGTIAVIEIPYRDAEEQQAKAC